MGLYERFRDLNPTRSCQQPRSRPAPPCPARGDRFISATAARGLRSSSRGRATRSAARAGRDQPPVCSSSTRDVAVRTETGRRDREYDRSSRDRPLRITSRNQARLVALHGGAGARRTNPTRYRETQARSSRSTGGVGHAGLPRPRREVERCYHRPRAPRGGRRRLTCPPRAVEPIPSADEPRPRIGI